MTETVQSARDELAFVKAVMEDKGPLPRWFGAHLFAVGLLFGLNLLVVGAWSQPDLARASSILCWAPATAIYLPVWFLIHRRSDYAAMGPTARVFGAAWLAVLLMTLVIVACLVTAQLNSGVAYGLIWPAIACTFYGGAWLVIALIRRRAWMGLVAAGCFATAVACAALIGRTGMLLALGAGLLLFFAVPGFALMRALRRQA